MISTVVMAGGVAGVASSAAAASATTGGTPHVSSAAALAEVSVGWYRIRSVNRPGECMEADPANAADPGAFTRVYVVPCDGGVLQRWFFGSTDPSYPAAYREVRNGAGRCLDADNRGGRLTGLIHIYTCNKSRNQAWAFSDPPGFGVACVFVAFLCDWRPTQATGSTVGKGFEVFLRKTTDGGSIREWLLEPQS